MIINDEIFYENVYVDRKLFSKRINKKTFYLLIYEINNKKDIKKAFKISKQKLEKEYLDLKHWVEINEEKTLRKLIRKEKNVL